MRITKQHFSDIWPDPQGLLGLIWELVPHRNAGVRSLCASILSKLVGKVDATVLKDKVLPGLVTLSADADV